MRQLPISEIVRLATAPIAKGVTVDLTGLEITDTLDLSDATLGNLDFSGSRFLAPAAFRNAWFQGLAWFKGCRFASSFDAAAAMFSNDLRMKDATFSAPVVLSRAELHGVFDLDNACFEDRADLDGLVCFGNTSMAATEFMAPVTLQGSDLLGGLWCDGTRFHGRADFRGVEVHGRTWLRGARLSSSEGPAGPTRRDPARDIQSYGYRWS